MRALGGTIATLMGGLAVLVAGCAPSESESPSAPAIVAAAVIPPLEVHVEQPAAKPVESKPEMRVEAPPAPDATKTEESAPAVEESIAIAPPAKVEPTAPYEPPFPNRTDLFVPPKRAGGAAAGQSSGDNAVQLLGFVRVDQPKAVLSINGEIAPMAVGESRYGVDVISIAPPNVVLQRGRQRWQTTLE
jgi:hypothetical protein